MKKIFTLIAFSAAAISMMATDFALCFRGEPVVNGNTYKTGWVVEEAYDEGGWFSTDWLQDSHLTFQGEPGMSVTATVTLTEGSASWCGIQTTCSDLNAQNPATQSATRTGLLVSDGQDFVLDNRDANYKWVGVNPEQIDGKETPAFPTVKATITAQETNNAASKVTIYLEMLNLPDSEVINMGGVNSAVADNGYIKAIAGNIISYNVEGRKTLSIYAITGNQVGRYSISGMGAINLSSLPSGIYIYTDGQHKGKFIVR